jgi:hypothetical protein
VNLAFITIVPGGGSALAQVEAARRTAATQILFFIVINR